MFTLRSVNTLRFVFFAYLFLVTLLITSCQKSNSNNSAVNAQCVHNPSLCNQGIYHGTPGYSAYNYGYGNGYGNYGYNNGYSAYGPFHQINNSAYLCNCPAGSVPTYNSYGGLGCVQTGYIGGYGYAYLGYGANNNQWTNIPQISNIQGYNNNGCYNGVVQSCIVTQANTCSAGYTCRPTSGGSAIGLCVNGAQSGGTIFR